MLSVNHYEAHEKLEAGFLSPYFFVSFVVSVANSPSNAITQGAWAGQGRGVWVMEQWEH